MKQISYWATGRKKGNRVLIFQRGGIFNEIIAWYYKVLVYLSDNSEKILVGLLEVKLPIAYCIPINHGKCVNSYI
jgi:hypothetical protein